MAGPNSSAEIVVIGGGPAGCAAALRLARLGHDVLLLDRGGPERPAGHESAPAALPGVLQGLGLTDADVRAAGLGAPVAGWVHWQGAAEPASGAPGCLVDRARFDAALQRAARAAGARWLSPVHAHAPRQLGDGRWCVALHEGATVVADAVLVASGGGARAAAGQPRTVAWCGRWIGVRGTAARTVVEAVADGWAWAAAPGDGSAAAVLFLDAAEAAGLNGTARLGRYGNGLAHCAAIAALLRGAAPPGAVRVAAAAALHTARRRPDDAALAWRFLRGQQQRERERHARWCAASYRAAGDRFVTAFWSRRSKDAADDPRTVLPAPARPWPALDAPVMLDGRAMLAAQPMLEGDWIVSAPALEHPGLAAPVGFVGGRPVAALLQDAPPGTALGELLRRWRDVLGAPTAVALAQDWWRAGALVPWAPPAVAAPGSR
jgi:2-polyprenyl-6-methoxyphenol hydroxylase-like FAD-dependent oxidoreductase